MLRTALITLLMLNTLAGVAHAQPQPESSSSSLQPNSLSAGTLLAQQTRPSRPTQRRVQVFFPRYPEAANDFTQVVPVWRTTASSSIARFALEQLFAGPTSAEQRQGLAPAVRLRGRSNCRGDFSISIANGVATIQLCRQAVSNGIGDDARAKSAIEATLKQFSSIDRVVVLNSDGSCFADQSGENLCFASL